MSTKPSLNIGISMGDPNGVGPEIIIKALQNEVFLSYFTPIIYGNPKVFDFYTKELGIEQFKYNLIKDNAAIKTNQINLVPTGNADFAVNAGVPSKDAGEEAYLALSKLVEGAKLGAFQAMVTAPIDKKQIQNESFNFNGHTGYLAHQFEVENYIMLLSSDNIKVGLVTEHVALNDVAKHLTTELIEMKITALNDTLKRDFSITKPKIAVLGLNPHNGDDGLMGEEEANIIKPAIKSAFDKEILAFGPYAADGFFGNRLFKQFDGIIAMYHDQGLIPFKYIAFEDGINFTAGLPMVRTSPDHGTAYDIAGKNIASSTSFVNALFEAVAIAYSRNENEGMRSNFLAFSKLRPERFKMDFTL